MSRDTSLQNKRKPLNLGETAALKGVQHEVPQEVKLSFSELKKLPSLARNLKLSAEAISALRLFPRRIQQEILTSFESDTIVAQKIPNTTDTFVAKSPNGYRIVFQKHNDTKSLVQIVTPDQLNSFKKVMK